MSLYCPHKWNDLQRDLAEIGLARMCDLMVKDYFKDLENATESHETDCQCEYCKLCISFGTELVRRGFNLDWSPSVNNN